jgi:hypothetical protein
MMTSDTIEVLLRSTVFVTCGLLLPQLLAYLIYRSATKKASELTVLAFLIAPAVYFCSAFFYWEHGAAVVRSEGHRPCGAMGMAAAVTTMFGTLFHLIATALLLGGISWLRKRNRVQSQPAN